MIDIEQDVYLAVRTAVLAAYPKATVSNVEERSPAKFPFVSVQELNNSTLIDTIDSGSNERHANVMYQVDCYSNATKGRKSACKALYAVVDDVMIRAGFARSMTNPVNMDRGTVYRITARYVASVDTNNVIYRR